MNSESVVVGMFETPADAARARSDLLAAGISASAVSLHPNTPDSGDAAGSSGTVATSGTATPHEEEGMFSRFLHSIFGSDDDVPERSGYEATYGEAMRRGHYGVTVQVRDETELQRVEEILNGAGAIDLDERSERWRSEGWTGGTSAASAATGSTAALSTEGTTTLPLVEEELKVGKRVVSRGGVRIVSRTLEVPVQESVVLREERANVERRTVDRPATEADFAAFKEGTIEVRNTAEEAVVSKSARVVGEVDVSKQATENQETVTDTVRKTEVDVEPIEDTARTDRTGSTTGTTGTTVPPGSVGSTTSPSGPGKMQRGN